MQEYNYNLSRLAVRLLLLLSRHPNLKGHTLREWPEGLAVDLKSRPGLVRKALDELADASLIKLNGPFISLENTQAPCFMPDQPPLPQHANSLPASGLSHDNCPLECAGRSCPLKKFQASLQDMGRKFQQLADFVQDSAGNLQKGCANRERLNNNIIKNSSSSIASACSGEQSCFRPSSSACSGEQAYSRLSASSSSSSATADSSEHQQGCNIPGVSGASREKTRLGNSSCEVSDVQALSAEVLRGLEKSATRGASSSPVSSSSSLSSSSKSAGDIRPEAGSCAGSGDCLNMEKDFEEFEPYRVEGKAFTFKNQNGREEAISRETVREWEKAWRVF